MEAAAEEALSSDPRLRDIHWLKAEIAKSRYSDPDVSVHEEEDETT